MVLIYVLQFITFVINLGLSIFVFLQNPKRLTNRAFAVFTLAAAFWALSIFIILNSPSSLLQLWIGRAGISFGSAGAAALLLFSLIFPWESRGFVWKKRMTFVSGVVFTVLPFFMVKSVEVKDGSIEGVFNNFQFLWLFYILFCFACPFFSITYKHYKNNAARKAGTQYVIAGFLSFVVPMILLNVILPNVFKIFKYNNLGPVFTIPMIVLISYAILKHRFLDIRVIIQKGLIYTLLLAAIIDLYLVLVFATGIFFSAMTNFAVIFSAGLTTIMGIFGAPILEGYFQRVTDKIFFKDKYDYKEALYELSEILNKNLDLKTLLRELKVCLRKVFKPEYVRIALGGRAEEFDPSDFLIQIKVEDKTVGTLVMGPKLSGDLYSVEDHRLLQTFSYQAGVALEKAELYNQALRHSDELEERVRARTAEIKKVQEEQRRMMLDISHGLQTPLTVMKIELEELKKQIPKSDSINILIKSISEISKFIYDLLSLARLESSMGSLKREKINLSLFLKELAEYLEVVLESEHVKLIQDIKDEVFVVGDSDKLKTVVINLVSNAIKYQDPGKAEKKIRLRLTKTKELAEILIEDNGLGISQKDLPHIFDRFFRVKDVKNSKGTGLGLAICKEIVEQHRGSISVESEPGKGTKFIVKI